MLLRAVVNKRNGPPASQSSRTTIARRTPGEDSLSNAIRRRNRHFQIHGKVLASPEQQSAVRIFDLEGVELLYSETYYPPRCSSLATTTGGVCTLPAGGRSIVARFLSSLACPASPARPPAAASNQQHTPVRQAVRPTAPPPPSHPISWFAHLRDGNRSVESGSDSLPQLRTHRRRPPSRHCSFLAPVVLLLPCRLLVQAAGDETRPCGRLRPTKNNQPQKSDTQASIQIAACPSLVTCRRMHGTGRREMPPPPCSFARAPPSSRCPAACSAESSRQPPCSRSPRAPRSRRPSGSRSPAGGGPRSPLSARWRRPRRWTRATAGEGAGKDPTNRTRKHRGASAGGRHGQWARQEIVSRRLSHTAARAR